jgi:hypothetical protein
MTDVQVCISLEDDPEIKSKHVVSKSKTQSILDSCVYGSVRIICVQHNRMLYSKPILVCANS